MSKWAWYHGTDEESAKSILKHGLKPSKSQRDDEPRKFSFVSRSPKTAKSFEDSKAETIGGSGTVLEVRAPGNRVKKMRHDLGEFDRVPVDIPPQYIKKYED